MRLELTAVYMKDGDGYVAWIEELHGAHTQGDTLGEARDNLRDVVLLLIDTQRERTRTDVGDAELIRETLLVEEADLPYPIPWNAP